MHLAAVRCRVQLHSLLPTDDACSSSIVCQRPSSNFPYFRTPLTNFLLSRPNSVEYGTGNSKTTTLLSSAKCTRPLFQGRTGCGGRPSGWHHMPASSFFYIFLLYRVVLVTSASDLLVRKIRFCFVVFDTIRYDSVYLTCSKKLTGSQLSLPHGTNKKLKCNTKNKMMSVIGRVQSRYREAVQ